MRDFRFKEFRFILASASPRRQFLLKELGIDFVIEKPEVDESFPEELQAQDIPLFLARKKADACIPEPGEGTILIAADTIVWINGMVFNKPVDAGDAKRMLMSLSGNVHQVFTGVCLKSGSKTITFYSGTWVWFRKLREEEIDYYIGNYRPFDKAGAYGAQEWIGYVGIEKIEGSYFNVMGLPLKELYENLTAHFIKDPV